MKRQLILTVNGEDHEIEAEPNRLLLYALRDDIGLTGTKEGCSIGVCGACSVIVDGRLVKSGGKELALELEQKGYEWIEQEVAAAR